MGNNNGDNDRQSHAVAEGDDSSNNEQDGDKYAEVRLVGNGSSGRGPCCCC
jgi:hypothetical protein